MIENNIHLYVVNHRWRFTIVFLLLGLSVCFAQAQVKEIFILLNLIHANEELTYLDYLMGMLNSPQPFMFIIFPTLFSFLIADLIQFDRREMNIYLVLCRFPNRLNYIISKLSTMAFLAAVYVFILLILTIIIWPMLGVPLSGDTYHYIFSFSEVVKKPIIWVWVEIFSIFYLLLLLVGVLTLVISELFTNAAISVFFIILLGYGHNVAIVMGSEFLFWLPFSQAVLGLHSEFIPFGYPKSSFTIIFSRDYLISALFLSTLYLIVYFNKKRTV